MWVREAFESMTRHSEAGARTDDARTPATDPGPATIRLLLLGLAGLLAWLLSDVLLLIFVGLLMGTALDALATPVANRTPLPRRLVLVLVAVTLLTGAGAAAVLIVPRVAGQADQLWSAVIGTAEAASDAMSRWGWPDVELDDASDIDRGRMIEMVQEIGGRLAGMTVTTLGVLGGLFVAMAIGLLQRSTRRFTAVDFSNCFPRDKRNGRPRSSGRPRPCAGGLSDNSSRWSCWG